jgi:hypothetical protein
MIRFKNIKTCLRSVLLFTVLLFFTDMACFSQTNPTLPDSSKVSLKSSESDKMNQNQNQNQSQNKDQTRTQAQNKNQGNTQQAANANAVKRVRSAKPDMSKAKGARPNIVRPSGSGMPKGAGKPGGAKRMGGR